VFERHADRGRNLGLALIRDGNGARAFDTLLRYRGTTLAELWRALRLLKALQAEQVARPEPAAALEPRLRSEPQEKPIEPCLARMWHGSGAPTPCTGSARGVGDRNEPRDPEPVL
jgi:hypothetical protein